MRPESQAKNFFETADRQSRTRCDWRNCPTVGLHTGSKEAATTMADGTVIALRQEDILPIGNALSRIIPQTLTERTKLMVVNGNGNAMPLEFLYRLS
jgi:hypothetical protein